MRFSKKILLLQSLLMVQSVFGLKEEGVDLPALEKTTTPLYLTADSFVYDTAKNIITAKGHVVLVERKNDQERVLRCEELVFDQLKDTVLAKGDVSLKEPGGDIFYVPELFIHDSFQQANVKSVRGMLSDMSRLVAAQGQKINDDLMILQKASYTPCKLCEINPKASPAWQINAKKVVYDKKDQSVVYENATIDMWGIPVFYTPYFSQTTAKRKSGFLMPSFFSNSDLGATISTPYYYAISDFKDLTLTPIFTGKHGPVLVAEYRQQFYDALWTTSASFTQSKNLKKSDRPVETLAPGSSEVTQVKTPNRDRYHFFTRFDKHINDHQRFLIDLQRASDTTYLRRYPVQNRLIRTAQEKNLTSQVLFEDFRPNSYGVVGMYAFQTDKLKTTPYVLPAGTFFWHNQPGHRYGEFSAETQVLSLLRAKDTPGRTSKSLQRLSQNLSWQKEWILNSGLVLDLGSMLDMDAYLIQQYRQYSTTKTSQNFKKGRFHPKGSLGLSFPVIAHKGKHTWLLEPKIALLSSPRISQRDYPNEDSLYSELDETTLFSPHRFHGRDRMDVGTRAVAGMTTTWFGLNRSKVSLFLGQSYRIDKTNMSEVIFGERKGASDYVSKLTIRPNSWLNLVHKGRINRSTHRLSLSESTMTLGNKRLTLDTTHTFLSGYSTPTNQPVSQVSFKATSFLTDEWAFSVQHARNLKRNQGGALSTSAGIQYENDCLTVRTGVYQTSYRDRDIQPDKGIMLQINFKTLGTFTPVSGPQTPFV